MDGNTSIHDPVIDAELARSNDLSHINERLAEHKGDADIEDEASITLSSNLMTAQKRSEMEQLRLENESRERFLQEAMDMDPTAQVCQTPRALRTAVGSPHGKRMTVAEAAQEIATIKAAAATEERERRKAIEETKQERRNVSKSDLSNQINSRGVHTSTAAGVMADGLYWQSRANGFSIFDVATSNGYSASRAKPSQSNRFQAVLEKQATARLVDDELATEKVHRHLEAREERLKNLLRSRSS